MTKFSLYTSNITVGLVKGFEKFDLIPINSITFCSTVPNTELQIKVTDEWRKKVASFVESDEYQKDNIKYVERNGTRKCVYEEVDGIE